MNPRVLIVSTTLDFSTDMVCLRLNEMSVPYLRLNRDQFHLCNIKLDPLTAVLEVEREGINYIVKDADLQSVYYRAPTFLRDIYQSNIGEDEQLYRTQWAALIRSLIVFEKAEWINNPVNTYKAENKCYQLKIAAQVGFDVPSTSATNTTFHTWSVNKKIALKSIDTAIVSDGIQEKFAYTQIFDAIDLPRQHYNAPFFIQEALTPKVDIRVTVCKDWLVATSITSSAGIYGDWRKEESKLIYQIIELPKDIEEKCFAYVQKLDLVYAGIDLILHNGKCYFIEINPTGEWAFIQQNTNYRIDEVIARALLGKH